MFSKAVTGFVSVGLLLGTAAAICQIPNTITDDQRDSIAQSDTVCKSQGAGAWTFAMTTDLSSYPLLGDSDGGSLYLSGSQFLIFDNGCKLKGVYEQPDCSIPYTIEDSFLEYVITVNSVFFDVGDPYFNMAYGNGEFVINNNGCTCGEMDDSINSVSVGCRCAFPIDGTVDKRGIEGLEKGGLSAITFRA